MRSYISRFAGIAAMAMTLGLAACGDGKIEPDRVRYQADAVLGLTKDPAFAKSATTEAKNISNGHTFSVTATGRMPKWNQEPLANQGRLKLVVSTSAASRTTYVSMVFTDSIGDSVDLITLKNGVCDDQLTIPVDCSNVSKDDWKSVYDAAVEFARVHGGKGNI